MPTYEVTTSDGRVYEVEADDENIAQTIGDEIEARRAFGADDDVPGAEHVADIGPDGRINFGRVTADAKPPETPSGVGRAMDYLLAAGGMVNPAGPMGAMIGEGLVKGGGENKTSLSDLISGGGYTPKASLLNSQASGAWSGFADEVAGVSGALGNAITAPFRSDVDFDPIGAYQRVRDEKRADIDATYQDSPWLAPLTEIQGMGMSPLNRIGGGAAKGTQTLGMLARRGMGQGAAQGAIAGFGYGEGAQGSLLSSLVGAGIGTTLGGLTPVVTRGGSNAIRSFNDWRRAGEGRGRQIVAKSLANDGIRPRDAARTIWQGQQDGVPLALMDVGDQTRGVAASLARKPGAQREIIQRPVLERQAGQGERATDAIERDLGPVGDVDDMSAALGQRAQAAAKPLYETAYAATPVHSNEMDELLGTPAGREALKRAYTIASNERVDPAVLGMKLMPDGSIELGAVPTPRMIDLVKRGLDDVLEGGSSRNEWGKLTTSGRAVNEVRASVLKEADKLYPDYAKARTAFAGPAQERTALEAGRKAAKPTTTAAQITRETAKLTPGQREQYALGHRSSLVDMIGGRVDGGDKAGALLGTPKKRQALETIYGPVGGLARFLRTMDAEKAANQTYRAISGNSATAERGLFDSTTDQATKGVTDAAADFMSLNPLKILRGLHTIAKAPHFGPGEAGKRASQEAASLLSETDAIAFRKALREVERIEAGRAKNTRAIDRTSQNVGGFFGKGSGALSGVVTRPEKR